MNVSTGTEPEETCSPSVFVLFSGTEQNNPLPSQVLITPGGSFRTDPKVSELMHRIIPMLCKYNANFWGINSIKFYKGTVQLKDLSSD